MIFGDYPTPGNVKVYIGNAWIDDAYRVEWNEGNAKVPLTGFHQKHVAMVADGKVLVVGNLIIHYRFPGYLTYAIKSVLNRREEGALQDPPDIAPPVGGGLLGLASGSGMTVFNPQANAFTLDTKDSVLQSINAIRRMTPSQRVQTLVASHKMGYFNSHSVLLNAIYGEFRGNNSSGPLSPDARKHDPLESPVEMSPYDYEKGHDGVDLRLYYGYVGVRDKGIYVTEVLKGVHFTGRRKVVNASTSGGDMSASGQSLLEVYPFFARNVVPLIEDRPPAFLGV